MLLRSGKCLASSQKGRQHGCDRRGHLLILRLGLRPRPGSHTQVLQALTLTNTWYRAVLGDGARDGTGQALEVGVQRRAAFQQKNFQQA